MMNLSELLSLLLLILSLTHHSFSLPTPMPPAGFIAKPLVSYAATKIVEVGAEQLTTKAIVKTGLVKGGLAEKVITNVVGFGVGGMAGVAIGSGASAISKAFDKPKDGRKSKAVPKSTVVRKPRVVRRPTTAWRPRVVRID